MYTTIAIVILFSLFSRNFSNTKRYLWIATALAVLSYTPLVAPLYFALGITLKTISCWLLVAIAHRLIPSTIIWRWSVFGQSFMFATANAGGGLI